MNTYILFFSIWRVSVGEQQTPEIDSSVFACAILGDQAAGRRLPDCQEPGEDKKIFIWFIEIIFDLLVHFSKVLKSSGA